MKEVESVRSPHVKMNPITWQQVEQTTKMLREATITVPVAKVQVRGVLFATSLISCDHNTCLNINLKLVYMQVRILSKTVNYI